MAARWPCSMPMPARSRACRCVEGGRSAFARRPPGTLVHDLAIGGTTLECGSTHRMSLPRPDLVERLDRLLPQTQCGQCGFDGCRPYAEAMVRGEAGIDRCP